MMLAGPARAQDATWSTTPFSNDYSLNLDWVPTGPPPGTATFGASSVTSLVSNGNVTHQAMVLNAGAADYPVTNNFFYSLTGGAGVPSTGQLIASTISFCLLVETRRSAPQPSPTLPP